MIIGSPFFFAKCSNRHNPVAEQSKYIGLEKKYEKTLVYWESESKCVMCINTGKIESSK